MKRLAAVSIARRATCVMVLCAIAFVVAACNDNSTPDDGKATPEWVIIETDVASSTDDLFAMDILYRVHDMGKMTLKAIMVNREGLVNGRFADIMNTYYRHPEIPIGMVHEGVKTPPVFIDYWKMACPDKYTDEPRFATTLTDSEIEQLPDAVTLYRRILSQAVDGKVNIVSVGFPTNLAQLLLSKADEYSPLDGVQLVRNKVKALYLQAGSFGNNPEPDYNFCQDPENAMTLISKWPSAIYFSPTESGREYYYQNEDVLADLKAAGSEDSPIYHVYDHHHVDDEQYMWDAMCALQLVAPELFKCEGPYDSRLDDDMIVHNTSNANGKHFVQLPPMSEQEKAMVMTYLREWMRK